jgi:hypothetical protein
MALLLATMIRVVTGAVLVLANFMGHLALFAGLLAIFLGGFAAVMLSFAAVVPLVLTFLVVRLAPLMLPLLEMFHVMSSGGGCALVFTADHSPRTRNAAIVAS